MRNKFENLFCMDVPYNGELTETVRHNSYSTILFDEVEKTHPKVLNLLLV